MPSNIGVTGVLSNKGVKIIPENLEGSGVTEILGVIKLIGGDNPPGSLGVSSVIRIIGNARVESFPSNLSLKGMSTAPGVSGVKRALEARREAGEKSPPFQKV